MDLKCPLFFLVKGVTENGKNKKTSKKRNSRAI